MRADILAGLSTAGLLLPEAIAYAGIGGVPPAHAIAAAVAGLVVYAVVGRSRFALVAPTSSSAAIAAAAVAEIAGGNGADRSPVVAAMVLLVGLFFVAASLARLGFLASFISRPALRGFAFGLATTIVVKQLPLLLGADAHGAMPRDVLVALWRGRDGWSGTSLAVGLAALAALLLLRRRRGIPAGFIVLALGIAASVALDLGARGVALVGSLQLGGLVPGPPDLATQTWLQAAQLAIPLFLIVYAESWGAMRSLALRHGDALDPDRELLALGLANLAAGLVRGMPVGAGFSASAANEAAGATSRAAGPMAALVIVALLLAGTDLIVLLPQPILAAIVIGALLHGLDPAPILRLRRLGGDFWVALGGVAGVLLLGIVDGMLLAIALSLATALQRFARSKVSELGELPPGGIFVDRRLHPEARGFDGIVVIRPNEPLFFANAERIFAGLRRGHAHADTLILSLEETADLDSTAADALAELADALARAGVRLLLAHVRDEVNARLARAGITGLSCFRTVGDALAFATGSPARRGTPPRPPA